jgi:ketosteroid isomerase-like protein
MSVGATTFGRMTTVPDVISRYYAAAAASDLDTLIGSFTADAHVRDEGHDYYGVAEIRTWRESVASQFTYTTEITGVEQTGDREYLVSTHLEGDFPGGVVDLDQRFTLADGLISDLSI